MLINCDGLIIGRWNNPKGHCMAKPFIVIESEAKAQTLSQQFDGDCETIVVDAPLVQVFYIPPRDKIQKENIRFKFAPAPMGKAILEKLSNAEDVYLAFDCDNRGEYWSWMISEYLINATSGARVPRRLHLLGMAREELQESFRLVEPVQRKSALAFHVRAILNGCLTKHLQRLLGTGVGPNNLPLNYYSLTTIFLLVDREEGIKAFRPSLKWQVDVKLAVDDMPFSARLLEAYGITDDGFVRDASQGKEAINLFMGAPFVVKKVERSEFTIQPPAPYRFAELLHDAFVRYGILPKKVADTLQRLFSGVEVGGVLTGLITSPFLPEHAVINGVLKKIRREVVGMCGKEAVAVHSLESGGGDEDAILPICPEIAPEILADILEEDEIRVYGLIRARALASQMNEARGENIAVEFQAGEKCLFTAKGRHATDRGFLAVYQGAHELVLLDASPLAGIKEKQVMSVVQIVPEQTSGFSPEFYGFESFFTDLADFGIGLDYPAIAMLQSMINSGYLSIESDGSLRCQANSIKVASVMSRAFPSMAGTHLSAYYEQTVNEVVSGRKSLAFAFQQFDQTLMMRGETLVKVSLAPGALRPRLKRSSRIIKGGAEPVAQVKPADSIGTVTQPVREKEKEVPAAPEVKPMEQVQEEVASPVELEKPVLESVGKEELTVEDVPEETVPFSEEMATETEAESSDVSASVEEEALIDIETALSEETEEMVPEALVSSGADFESEGDGAVFEKSLTGVEAETPGPQSQEQDDVETSSIESERLCPKCAKPLLLKKDSFGKYWYCSGHPACRYAESYDGAGQEGISCPLCQAGNVIAKKTPVGRTFYVCPEADCEFMAWSLPHSVPCQSCSSPFLVEKKSVAGKIFLRCPRAGCNYKQPIPGDTTEDFYEDEAPKKKVLVRRVKSGSGTGGKRRLVRVVKRKK